MSTTGSASWGSIWVRKEDSLPPPGAENLAQATFTPSGLVFLSGTTAGMGAVTDEDADIEKGIEAGREAGIQHIRVLHWGLHPLGTLNDVWYCVKGFGMVNSAGGGVLTLSHLVVNGYSKVFHDVFGGPLSQFAEDGRGPISFRFGTHAVPSGVSICPRESGPSPR